MLFATDDEVTNRLKGLVSLNNGSVIIENSERLITHALDTLVENSVLNPSAQIRGLSRFIIKSVALELGIVLSSIQGLYDARGQGECSGFTVPAINIRGMSYDFSRSIFRTAQKLNTGSFIFEIAKSEIGYTFQQPHEIVGVILGAAIREKHTGPVFIQGDHFQVNAKKFL
ncbi:uncharacterized protein METZ01_LOCUS337251, partial [marine metagenome]